MYNICMRTFIAFACNAERFAITFSFSFSLSSVFLDGRTKAFSYVSVITVLGACDQYQTNFIEHTKTRCVINKGSVVR